MALSEDYVLAFNRGVISELALARADVKRVGMSASEQMNFIPRIMGPMSLRPGMEYIGTIASATGGVRLIPFIFSNNDKALIEVTSTTVRVWDDDVALVTRPTVATTITNPDFTTDLTGWTDADQGAAVSQWVGQYMQLTGTGVSGAVRYQTVTIAAGDLNKEHALTIEVLSGVSGLRVGTTTDDDDLVNEAYLGKGLHSLAFTPATTTIYILFFNRSMQAAAVNSCNVAPAGPLVFSATLQPDENFDELKWAQSGDVIFLARGITRAPMKVERRGNTSWSIVDYISDNGPFRAANTTPVTLISNALTDVATITASQNIFKSSNVGSLYRITNTGQIVSGALGVLNATTNSIKVTGIGDNRRFAISLTGTWVATIVLEQSLVEEGSWTTVATHTTNQNLTYDDTLDNQVAYYRWRVSAYTSGTATGQLSISTGSTTGIVRMTAFTSASAMTAIVVKNLGGLTATKDWAEGAWSARRGYPSAVALFQGRLYWAGTDKVWASVVDDFYNFDPDTIGDAGPLNRSIGTGPVESINWLMPLRYLAMGADGSEFMCRSTNFEDPVTPSNFNLRELGTYGSAKTNPVKIDNSVVYVDKTGSRAMELTGEVEGAELNELTALIPEILQPKTTRVAVQRRPDTRVQFVRCDGVVVVVLYDKIEEVKCFFTIETQGLVEDVVILPSASGEKEDRVYYAVARVVGGVVVRYLECMAMAHEAVGGVTNKIADAFKEFTSGTATVTVTGLSHLEGRSVIVWGNSKDLGTYTVSGGSITLSEAVTYAVIGLGYHAMYSSNKLGFLTLGSQSLAKRSRITSAALLLKDTHKNGLEYGTDVNYLDQLPPVEDEVAVPADMLWSNLDNDPIAVNGTIANDTRLVLKANAPRPCTVLAVVVQQEYIS